MKSNIANILRRLTVPFDARNTDPRVVIATDDPLAAGFSRAAISFYWDDARGFVAGVNRSGDGPSAVGQWRLWAIASGLPVSQLIDAQFFPDLPDQDGVRIRGGTRASLPAQVLVRGPNVDLGAEFPADAPGREVRLFGRPLPRGLITRFPFTGGTQATAGVGEIVVATTDPATYAPDRAYEVRFRCQVSASAAPTDVLPKFRKGSSVVGAVLADRGWTQVPALTDRAYEFTARFCTATGGPSVVAQLSYTARTGAGTCAFKGSALGPLELTVHDIGSATDFPDLPILT